MPDSGPSAESARTHIARCPTCRKALERQERLFRAISSLEPDQAELARFRDSLRHRIPQDSSPSGPRDFLWKMLLLGSILLLIGGGIAFHAFQPPATPPAQEKVSPPTTIPPHVICIAGTPVVRSAGNPALERSVRNPTPLPPGSTVAMFDPGAFVIRLQSGGLIAVTGTSVIRLVPGGMEIPECRGDFLFSKVEKGFKISLPQGTASLRGTRLHIAAATSSAAIWVADGAISWKHSTSPASGSLSAGSGIVLSPSGVFPLSFSPLSVGYIPDNGNPLQPDAERPSSKTPVPASSVPETPATQLTGSVPAIVSSEAAISSGNVPLGDQPEAGNPDAGNPDAGFLGSGEAGPGPGE